jgi:hypothetical protein
LQIAPSCYRRHAAQQRNPQLRCARAKRDDELIAHIQRVWHANMQVYGADKVWQQMNREGIAVARCTVERLMRRLGIQGVRRGKVVRTTVPDTLAPCPLDRVNRVFKAERPNQLWVSDFTYVSTWQGWLYVAFVIDVYARRIVGWRVSSTMRTDFVLDALEQALYDRQPERSDALVHHSDRGSQGEFNWSSQHLQPGGVYGATRRMDEAIDRERRDALSGGSFASARGRASVLGTDCNRDTSERAAEAVGVSQAVGSRWFRHRGGMPLFMSKPVSGRYLSFAEREEIGLLRAQDVSVREIARRIGRSPSTVSRELTRNAATRSGKIEYRASVAQWKSELVARRPKPAKLVMNQCLREYVQDRLEGKIHDAHGREVAGP